VEIFSKNKNHLPTWLKKVEELKKIRIVRMKGVLNAFAVTLIEKLDARARKQKGYEFKHVLLDFEDVTSMDSSAVAGLLKALAEYKKTHQKLAIVNLKEAPRHMLRLAKVSHLFPSYATEAQAVKDLETRF
jgi:anti-anti-sigma factor